MPRKLPPLLTAKEQAHVRTALCYLHTRIGSWAVLAKAIRSKRANLRRVRAGQRINGMRSLAARGRASRRCSRAERADRGLPAAGDVPALRADATNLAELIVLFFIWAFIGLALNSSCIQKFDLFAEVQQCP